MSRCVDISRYMEMESVLSAFGALSQATRLETVRLLVKAGEDGLAAGEIARRLGARHNTMSAHLNVLTAADLVSFERQGRQLVYTARFDTLRSLLSFLMTDCCQGLPEIVSGLATGIDEGDCNATPACSR